jgi:SAM-dependent methyltransferase
VEESRVGELLGDVEAAHVADLGCGTGRHAVRIAAAGARVTALDFAEGMVARARAKPGWEQVEFIAHDLARPLPLADRAFDRVLSCLVAEHLPDLPGFFGECRRICRPGGFVVVSAMHPALLLRGIQARFIDPTSGRDVRPAGHPYRISDYVMGAVAGGLTIEHMSEHAVDADHAARSPRAARYLGWPLLLLFRLTPVLDHGMTGGGILAPHGIGEGGDDG